MSFAFINCTYETFTPANSGAICTWIWEQCKWAGHDGLSPLVISRSSPHLQYDRPGTFFVDYPELAPNRVAAKWFRAEQHLRKWQHPRHGIYARRIADAIRAAGARKMPLVLSNDPELAVMLRDWFPDAFIFHHVQNANTTTTRYRERFKEAVNVATACSNYCARWNEEYFGMPNGSIATMYNGADTDAYAPRQDWDDPRPLINFVGKTDPIKGPDILLKAALRLAQRTHDFRLQIVGRKFYDREETDAYQTELQAMARKLEAMGVEVIFTGWVNRQGLPAVLGRAHIHVVPSRWDEPSALTIYEGMACGMATIGSRTGGTPEIIADHGFIFERDNDAQLADLLEPLVRDHALCRVYGHKARARAETLTWRNAWEQLKSRLPLECTALPALPAAAVTRLGTAGRGAA